MIPRDGLLGRGDYPPETHTMTPPARPTFAVTDEATEEQWTTFRVWLRREGFVDAPMPDGTTVKREKQPAKLNVMTPSVPPAPPKAAKPAADWKAKASGERDDPPEDDAVDGVPF